MQATSSFKQNKLIAKNFLVSEGNVDQICRQRFHVGVKGCPNWAVLLRLKRRVAIMLKSGNRFGTNAFLMLIGGKDRIKLPALHFNFSSSHLLLNAGQLVPF